MEELQDAIEDAQYVNAIQGEIPKPNKEWKWPTAEEQNDFMTQLSFKDPSSLELDSICKDSLGIYLYIDFVKENGEPHLGSFIMEVLNYRSLQPEFRLKCAKAILNTYLLPTSVPMPQSTYDPTLARTAPYASGFAAINDPFEPDQVDRNLVNIVGPPVEDVIKEINEVLSSNICETVGTIELSNSAWVNRDHNFSPRSPKIGVDFQPASKEPIVVNELRIYSGSNAAFTDMTSVATVSVIDQEYITRPPKELPLELFDVLDFIVFERLRKSQWTQFQSSNQWIKYFKFVFLSVRPVTEDDFTLFRILGRGGFGLVNGCKKRTTGKLYAMKVMNKKRVKLKRSDTLCRNERMVLQIIDSPFVVCLKYAFSTPLDLYLILDLMMGGDLGYHLQRKHKFSLLESKYYAARTLLGLKALHAQSIVYRDLKPENILMDADGTTKISDLGLATVMGRGGLYDACGTRGYWAPEMIRRDEKNKRMRYTETVDWFSFGCCVYEFLYGCSPFRTERARNWNGLNPKRDKEKALDAALLEMDPEFDSKFFDANSIDLCTKLLDKDGKTRLGAGGAQEIMDHPWFDDVNWAMIESGKEKPPFRPGKDINLFSQSDIGTFDERATKGIELTVTDQAVYSDWGYVSKKCFMAEIVEILRYEEVSGPIRPTNISNACCTLS